MPMPILGIVQTHACQEQFEGLLCAPNIKCGTQAVLKALAGRLPLRLLPLMVRAIGAKPEPQPAFAQHTAP